MEAMLDNKANLAVFSGEVDVKSPQYTVNCDKLTVYLKKSKPAGAEPKPAEARPIGADDPAESGNGDASDSPADKGTDKPPVKPAPDKPAADKATTDKPATDKPATDKPATDKPATDKPATDKPAVAKTSDKPASKKDAAKPAGKDDDDNGGIDTAIAEGNVKIVEIKPAVGGGKPEKYFGSGKKAVFDNAKQTCTLTGWPRVQQSIGNDLAREVISLEEGCVIVLNNDRIDVTSGRSITRIIDASALGPNNGAKPAPGAPGAPGAGATPAKTSGATTEPASVTPGER